MAELRLPEGALKSRTRFYHNEILGRDVLVIPYRSTLPKEQVKQIADTIAEYTRMQTGTYQEVIPVLDDLLMVRNTINAAPQLNANYRIFQDTSSPSELNQAAVYIIAEPSCIEPKTLETFVKEVVLQ